jgi:hypothetical protein
MPFNHRVDRYPLQASKTEPRLLFLRHLLLKHGVSVLTEAGELAIDNLPTMNERCARPD